MHRHTVSARDKADNAVSGKRITASCEFNEAALKTVHDNAAVGFDILGRDGLDLLNGNIGLSLRINHYGALKFVLELACYL